MECAKTTKGQLWNRTKHAQLYSRDANLLFSSEKVSEEDFVAFVMQRVF